MALSSRWLSGTVIALMAGTAGASAQNISNETWLGQVGGSNTITINQSGRNNQAGANSVNLLLNQNGNDNLLLIDQFGHRNQVGATPYGVAPTGINQLGGSNQIDVQQSTAAGALEGGNVVGAIYQLSSHLLQNASNVLRIIQSEDGGSGESRHGVGVVRQIYTGNDSNISNVAEITQKGGGIDAGNFLGYLTQVGQANFFTLLQEVGSNAVLSAIQTGRENSASLIQKAGTHNRLEYLHQWGYRNLAEVVMEGSHNVIEQVFQFNTNLGLGTQRNTAIVALHGEGNGGASGFPGNFLSEAALRVSVAQANIIQIGEANDTNIVVAGEDNKFGTQQFGDGNAVSIAIGKPATATSVSETANENESAIFQSGDGNWFMHKAMGDRNVAAVRQFGKLNNLEIIQINNGGLSGTQSGNLAEVAIFGNRNNSGLLAGQFSPAAGIVAATVALVPGRLYQNGLNNTIAATVSGDDNSFGIHQVGDLNHAEMTVTGSSNQIVVVQLGNENISVTRQFGLGNTAIIQQ